MTRLLRGSIALALVVLSTGCASASVTGGRLTPPTQRLRDSDVRRDLSVFRGLLVRADSIERSSSGGRRYLAARARQWLMLGQEAYERNDHGAFPGDMIAFAERDLAALDGGQQATRDALDGAVLFPNGVHLFGDDAWARAVQLRRDANTLGAPDELARAEALLLRAGHAFLGGPVCPSDPATLAEVSSILGVMERTRVTPVPVVPDTARQEVPPRPAPVPVQDSPPPPPRLPRECAGPEELRDVAGWVHFALDHAALSAASRAMLDRTVEAVRAYGGVRLVLTGHTDTRASAEYNRALAERRVEAVRAYLVQRGIDWSRIEASAFGEEKTVASGSTPHDHARNRRVEITYVRCDGSILVPVETLNDLQFERARRREK